MKNYTRLCVIRNSDQIDQMNFFKKEKISIMPKPKRFFIKNSRVSKWIIEKKLEFKLWFDSQFSKI
jgi:hypothetical protein